MLEIGDDLSVNTKQNILEKLGKEKMKDPLMPWNTVDFRAFVGENNFMGGSVNLLTTNAAH